MSDYKFKIGDRVRLVREDIYGEIGDEGMVIDVMNSNYRVTTTDGRNTIWYFDNCELIPTKHDLSKGNYIVTCRTREEVEQLYDMCGALSRNYGPNAYNVINGRVEAFDSHRYMKQRYPDYTFLEASELFGGDKMPEPGSIRPLTKEEPIKQSLIKKTMKTLNNWQKKNFDGDTNAMLEMGYVNDDLSPTEAGYQLNRDKQFTDAFKELAAIAKKEREELKAANKN